MELQFPNHISLIALDDSKHFEEEFTRPFRNISLLPILLGDQVFREPHHMRKFEEKYMQQTPIHWRQRKEGQETQHERTQHPEQTSSDINKQQQQQETEKKESRANA